MMRKIDTKFLILVLMIVACKPGRHAYQALPSKTENSDKIIFLSFSVQSDSLKASYIQLIEKKVVEGKLKLDFNNSNFEDRLVVKQLSKQLKELSVVEIDHPLFKHAEFADDQGKLERRVAKLSETEFFLRVEYQPDAEIILVEEILENIKKGSTTFKIKD